jgi:hypothetical protein
MKLTKESLKKIIKEELEAVMGEGLPRGYVAGKPTGVPTLKPHRGFDWTPEQKKVMEEVIEILNKMPTVSYRRMNHTLRYMKYDHPAFKGFTGEPLDIQTQMELMGLNKKHTISTTAMP